MSDSINESTLKSALQLLGNNNRATLDVKHTCIVA